MANPTHTDTVAEVPAGAHEEHGPPKVIDLSGQLAVWTWVTFAFFCVLLYKVAWKPILAGLDVREDKIRRSVDDAERIRLELAQLDETKQGLLDEAENEAKDALAQARKAAREAARVIEGQAKEEARIQAENAERQIKAAREKAQARLQRESAELAVALAGRLIGEELDEAKSRDLTDRLIEEL